MSTQTSADQEALALHVWVCLLRAHSAARRSLTGELLGEHGLTVNDYEALLLLSRADGNYMRRVDLAEGLQLTASGVTRLLDGLEEHTLVSKKNCSTDGRVTYAALTAAGRKKLEKASKCHIAAVQSVFQERFTQDELATLADLLGRLPGAVGAHPGDWAA